MCIIMIVYSKVNMLEIGKKPLNDLRWLRAFGRICLCFGATWHIGRSQFGGCCQFSRTMEVFGHWLRYLWVPAECWGNLSWLIHGDTPEFFLVYSRIHLFFFQATFLLCASFFHNFHKNNYVVDGSEIPPATTVWMVLKTQKKTWNIYHINWCQESIPRMDLLGDFADRMYLAHGIQPPHHVDKPKRRKLKANTGKQLSEIPVLLVALWFKV